MTDLAQKINKEMKSNYGVTAQEIFDSGIGSSVHEVAFIMEQIKIHG